MGVKEDWAAKVNAKGDEIRDAKKSKAAKEAIMPLVEQLKALKAGYEEAVGEPFPAAVGAQPKKKKAAAPAPKEDPRVDGKLSKNEEKKAARKAVAANKKLEYVAAGTVSSKNTLHPPKPSSGGGGGGGGGSVVASMNAAQVQAFLDSVALDRYATAFGGVDGPALAGMGDAALKSAGMTFAPHRRKILKLVSGSTATGGGSAWTAELARKGASIEANAGLLLTTVASQLPIVTQFDESAEAAAAPPQAQRAQRPKAKTEPNIPKPVAQTTQVKGNQNIGSKQNQATPAPAVSHPPQSFANIDFSRLKTMTAKSFVGCLSESACIFRRRRVTSAKA